MPATTLDDGHEPERENYQGTYFEYGNDDIILR